MTKSFIHTTVLILMVTFSQSVLATIQARYVKVLIDSGQGGIYDGALSIAELEIYDLAGVNLSLSASAAASSYSSIRYPSKAIDGNYTTIFATSDTSGLNPNGTQNLIIDLGSLKTISSIKLITSTLYNTASMTGYRIIASPDDVSYYQVVTITGASPTARTDSHDLNTSSNSDVMSVAAFKVYLHLIIALFILFVLTGALWIIFS